MNETFLMVLKQDVEEIGYEVAYDNAVNELWKVFGSIAKVVV